MIVNQFFYLVPVFLFLDNLDGRIADFLLLRLGPVQHVVVLHIGVQLYNLYNLTPVYICNRQFQFIRFVVM